MVIHSFIPNFQLCGCASARFPPMLMHSAMNTSKLILASSVRLFLVWIRTPLLSLRQYSADSMCLLYTHQKVCVESRNGSPESHRCIWQSLGFFLDWFHRLHQLFVEFHKRTHKHTVAIEIRKRQLIESRFWFCLLSYFISLYSEDIFLFLLKLNNSVAIGSMLFFVLELTRKSPILQFFDVKVDSLCTRRFSQSFHNSSLKFSHLQVSDLIYFN